MGQLGGLGITEVRECQLEEVDDNEKQSPPEVGASPKVDEAKPEEVVEDEVGCQVQRNSKVFRVGRLEDGCQIRDLDDEEHDPVDADDDTV